MKNVAITKVHLEIPSENPNHRELPQITADDYMARIRKLLDMASDYTHLVIYADKEHFSNLEYLTGYDPRYEECVLLLSAGQEPQLLVGNEGMGHSACIPISLKRELYQSFSPMGQQRGASKTLETIFSEFGICSESSVGVLGWKSFGPTENDHPKTTFEVPHYLIQALYNVCKKVQNANDLMMDNEIGLRITHCDKELLLSELLSTKASRKTWNFMKHLQCGQTEIEASQSFAIDGEPAITYPNVCFQGKGILSPDYHTELNYGQPIAFGMGYRYAQIHRVGIYARNESDIPAEYSGCVERLFFPYFRAVAAWFEALEIGATGAAVWDAVREQIGSYEDFGIVLNPGHAIHTEEWTNSPFYQGSPVTLQSGMLLQCDFTARPQWMNRLGVHIEDGVILADGPTRERLAQISPEAYRRMSDRQRFMREVLHIQLRDEVLPTSDLCGILHPFLADLDTILTLE